MESLASVNTDAGVEALRKQFEVNALGPLRVTAALASNLQPGSRVVMITSRMGSIGKVAPHLQLVLRKLLNACIHLLRFL